MQMSLHASHLEVLPHEHHVVRHARSHKSFCSQRNDVQQHQQTTRRRCESGHNFLARMTGRLKIGFDLAIIVHPGAGATSSNFRAEQQSGIRGLAALVDDWCNVCTPVPGAEDSAQLNRSNYGSQGSSARSKVVRQTDA